MSHSGNEHGTFTKDWKRAERQLCLANGCDKPDVWVRLWESDCGGWEDAQYECRSCRGTWWIDGIDS